MRQPFLHFALRTIFKTNQPDPENPSHKSSEQATAYLPPYDIPKSKRPI